MSTIIVCRETGRTYPRHPPRRRCPLSSRELDYEHPHLSTTMPGNRENTIWYSLSKYSIVISESFLGAQHGPVLFGGSARLTMWVFG